MKQNKAKIAVTGGIGSGKSTVCQILREYGFPVYSCDEAYRRLTKNKDFALRLAQIFGRGVLDESEGLDRKKLSEIVFANPLELEKLNAFTHPKIFDEMFEEAQGEEGVCFFEVPLLFEGGYEKLFDGVVVVLRDRESRMESVSARDHLTRKEVEERIFSQYNYDNADFEKYYVIHNDGNIDELKRKVWELLTEIRDS